MVPGDHAATSPNKPAYIMAPSGQIVTYGELEADANRIAHLFRSLGYRHGDGIAIYSENNAFFLKICWGAHRAGLYYTCVSSYLTADEVDYIVADCGARGFFTSFAKSGVAEDLTARMAGVGERYMVDGTVPGYRSLEDAITEMPAEMIADPSEGSDMLYSSGTTGRPKGIRSVQGEEPYGQEPEGLALLSNLYRVTPESVYLSPAPLYHAAPLKFNMGVLRLGGTSVIME